MFENVRSGMQGAKTLNTTFDAGLQKYMNNVYNHMALAVLVTAFSAMLTYSTPRLFALVYGTPLAYVIIFAPLAMSIYMQYKIETIAVSTAKIIFYAYAISIGLSLSYIFAVYTGQGITRCFLTSAGLFAWMSFYGYTTKKDLTSMGGILSAGFWGAIIFSLINLLVRSTGFEIFLSLVIMLIFIGLIAYETQNIKRSYYLLTENEDMRSKFSIISALSLYMSFVNLFLRVLYLFGSRRD